MKPGDTIEAAIWLNGEETPEQRRKFETDVREEIADACSQNNLMYGPVVFKVLKIGEERVPPVPDHIQGADVRLLVAETEIIGFTMLESGFTFELERHDLERLRTIARNSYAIAHHGATLTDMECDDVINEIGPEAALEKLRQVN